MNESTKLSFLGDILALVPPACHSDLQASATWCSALELRCCVTGLSGAPEQTGGYEPGRAGKEAAASTGSKQKSKTREAKVRRAFFY
jgi:hypothetical protein